MLLYNVYQDVTVCLGCLLKCRFLALITRDLEISRSKGLFGNSVIKTFVKLPFPLFFIIISIYDIFSFFFVIHKMLGFFFALYLG